MSQVGHISTVLHLESSYLNWSSQSTSATKTSLATCAASVLSSNTTLLAIDAACKPQTIFPSASPLLNITVPWGDSGPVKESAEIAETILMKLCDIDEENISHAAKSGWYKPLIYRVVQGTESSRIAMVKTLVNMELVDSNLKLLGEEGVIPPLLEMACGNIGSKESSLSALVQLSSCHANRKLIANSGGVNLVLKLLVSPTVRSIIVAKCYEVLEKFTSDVDGAKYFVDETGCQLELEPIVTMVVTWNI